MVAGPILMTMGHCLGNEMTSVWMGLEIPFFNLFTWYQPMQILPHISIPILVLNFHTRVHTKFHFVVIIVISNLYRATTCPNNDNIQPHSGVSWLIIPNFSTSCSSSPRSKSLLVKISACSKRIMLSCSKWAGGKKDRQSGKHSSEYG